MNEKKYLKWYNKVGYGSGDIAGNGLCVFVLLCHDLSDKYSRIESGNHRNAGLQCQNYLTGITDVFFGSLIDKTKADLVRQDPGCCMDILAAAVTLVAIFAIPADMGRVCPVCLVLYCLYSVKRSFYTANNIAYSALTALVTKNSKERVQMGSLSFYLCFFNQSSDPVSDHWICGMDGRRS